MGSTSYISTRNGSISQHVEYIAFGEILFEEHSSSFSSPYLFNGKELDRETNLSYYGARYLDMKTSLWLNVDPLALFNPTFEHEFYFDGQHNGGIYNSGNLSNYNYCYQNPIKYIDPNGKQANASVLLKANYKTYTRRLGTKVSYQEGYKFTQGASHLLSLVSGVSEKNISNAKINFQYTPVGGGALTEGSNSNNSAINVFWNDAPKGYVYNTNAAWIKGFFGLMAHEVGHIPQIDKAGGNLGHLLGSFAEYVNNWAHLNDSHDPAYAHKEAEAEGGFTVFENFNEFINNNYGKDKLSKLFENKNNTQKDIINRIDQWWKNYQKANKKDE
ncbi:RHS repeat-associated protein [Flavobacterium sp. 28A]|nr:RHS repeat-associated protein [Flavobacterium sp. 28A]